MRRGCRHYPAQRFVDKGERKAVAKVWRCNRHRWEDGTSESRAFQDASFEIAVVARAMIKK